MLIAEQPLSAGLHYSGPFDVEQDSGIARSRQSFSPCENSGSLDGMTEHRRNRANLQMSQRVRMDSAVLFDESHAFEKNSAKAMELRSKQRKLEGEKILLLKNKQLVLEVDHLIAFEINVVKLTDGWGNYNIICHNALLACQSFKNQFSTMVTI